MTFQVSERESVAVRPHFASLDGFRGILALLVAVYHTIWLSWPNGSAFLDNGAVIIDLFFAFSGFLMFTLYQDQLHTRKQAKQFLVRRFARLMPLHIFMLAVFVLFSLARLVAHEVGLAHQSVGEVLPFEPGAVESWRNLLAHLTLTHAMGGADQLAYNPPSWTVGAEFYTYILFALTMLVLAGREITFRHMAALTVLIIAIYAFLAAIKPDLNITHDWGFMRCVAGFAVGVVAAFITLKVPTNFGRRATAIELMTLATSVLFVIYCDGKAQFLVASILLLFIIVFARDQGAVSNLLAKPVFAWLAKISYSVYLVHVIIAIGFEIALGIILGTWWPDWRTHHLFGTLILVPYLGVVIGISCLTYRWVEKPGGRWLRNRLGARPRPVEAIQPAE